MNPRRRRHNRIARKARAWSSKTLARVFGDPKLDALLAKAQAAFDALPEDEKRRQRREQAISFAYGNLACSTNHRVPRELVEREYDRLHPRAST